MYKIRQFIIYLKFTVMKSTIHELQLKLTTMSKKSILLFLFTAFIFATKQTHAQIRKTARANKQGKRGVGRRLENQGENPIPRLQSDALLEEIRKWKRRIDEGNVESSVTDKIVQALQRAEDLLHQGPGRGELNRSHKDKQSSDVDLQNVVKAKRSRDKAIRSRTSSSSSAEGSARRTNVIRVKPLLDQKSAKLKVGDKVKTTTERFGKAYAVGKPKFTFGTVKKVKGSLVSILWEGELRRMNVKAHHLVRVKGASIIMATKSRGKFACPTYKMAPEGNEKDWIKIKGSSTR